ncbi:MAG: potassium-transporting ATPase subunit KdpA [Ilumatobacteraceae bacterium]
MSGSGFLQLVLLIAMLGVSMGPFGRYMAKVYGSEPDGRAPGDRIFSRIERPIYRMLRVDPKREQRWNIYALSMLAFSLVSVLSLYALIRLQGSLPFNPTDRAGTTPWGAFNAAVSFVTNTNWQWFSGEQAMSHLTQMLGFAVQNFVSAAVGMTIAIAFVRGIVRRGERTLGNFWVDLVRTTTRILLPISFVVALVLVSQGAIQNLHGNTSVRPLDTATSEQLLPGGPLASQSAIKQLGTNGGGFFNANSAHPYENPNGWTNILENYLLLLIPISLTVTFGVLAGSKRQGRTLLAVMFVFLLVFSVGAMIAEQTGNPRLTAIGVDQSASSTQTGGNMEGKDIRFGPTTCGLFAASTTGTSTGAVDCMHDSMTPLGGAAAMVHMKLGEVSPGGVGVGLAGMLINALMAVFIAGLMVGRTPEYLGKKIQAAEMKLVVLYLIAMPLVMLAFAAASVVLKSAITSVQSTDAHGLSEVLYNFASAANNNGSAFGYMNTGTQWYTMTMGIAMLVGRFFLIIPVLALGGSLVRKQRVPVTSGTFPTDTPLFSGLLAGVIAIIAGLTFFPALALGPIVEHLSL